MGLSLITPPAEEPVTLIAAKLQCKEDTETFDAAIGSWIRSAREQVEHRTGRALVEQVWKFTLPSFNCYSLTLPKSPLIEINSIKYIDTAGVLQTMDPTDYQVIKDDLQGRVVPAFGKSWPTARYQEESVRIEFKAGYGTAAAVPASLKSWMLLAIAFWYKYSEAGGDFPVTELPRGFCAGLLDAESIPVL